MTLRDAILAVYAQVDAPAWAAPNLDALADVLRDLSWLPDGEVRVVTPDLTELDDDAARRLLDVIGRSVVESSGGPHPVRWLR